MGCWIGAALCVGAAEWPGAAGAAAATGADVEGAGVEGTGVEGAGAEGAAGALARGMGAVAAVVLVEAPPSWCVAPAATSSTTVAMPVPAQTFRFVALGAPGGWFWPQPGGTDSVLGMAIPCARCGTVCEGTACQVRLTNLQEVMVPLSPG
ncbi:hypothetical protein LN042_15230 [Kitasatospora sp. RB6PN24]|uniref:hypothetical protein n=1 Tax=Kitasatospora humi TaxID=2893891 RepID=UPI001E55E2D3|nr:hypothetical protein [Kitasatospora humi]MCC9308424.1 hypothetical protein [Kitasatospora humi]